MLFRNRNRDLDMLLMCTKGFSLVSYTKWEESLGSAQFLVCVGLGRGALRAWTLSGLGLRDPPGMVPLPSLGGSNVLHVASVHDRRIQLRSLAGLDVVPVIVHWPEYCSTNRALWA